MCAGGGQARFCAAALRLAGSADSLVAEVVDSFGRLDLGDVAAAVVCLCSDAAAMINGHDIPVAGGQLAKP